MSISCPVCYENFIITDENDAHSCRKLPCGDFVCRDCISSEIFENTYYCPECGRDFSGSNVDEISEFISDPITIESSPNSPNASSSNLLADISPSSEYHSRRVSVRMPCAEPGCKNKAIAAGLCMHHASTGAKNSPQAGLTAKAVVHESRIAKNMAENSGLTDIIMSRGRFESRNQQFSIHPDDIIRRFKNQQRIELGEAMEILNTARDILSREPNILRIDAPVIGVGDIHGQFYDLLNLLEEGGKPGETSKPYLFLGDYVDRGSFSCEVIFTLLALKIAYPDKIYLLRGNHECGSVSSHFGFKQECKRKYGVNVYHRALLVFQTMPIASIISTAFGDIYACHGGLSPTLKTLEEIDAIDRFVEPEQNSGLLDILWSDPISENAIDDVPDDVFEEFLKVSWKPNPARGCSYCFGYSAIKEFLNKNGLVCIVRAHEVQADGFRRHFEPKVVENRLRNLLMYRVSELTAPDDEVFKRPVVMKRRPSVAEAEKLLKTELITEKDFPPVITIFSAPNYCDRYGNKAAILHIDSALDGFRVIQYDCVEHPVPDISDSQTENYMDAIIVACPYMPSSFRDFVKLALQLGPDESLVGELEDFHKMSKSSMSSMEGEQGTIASDIDRDSDVDADSHEIISDPIVLDDHHIAADDEIVISTAPEIDPLSSPSHLNHQRSLRTPKARSTPMNRRKSLTINIFSNDHDGFDSGPSSSLGHDGGGFKDHDSKTRTPKEEVRHLLLEEDIDAELHPIYRDSLEMRRKAPESTKKSSSSIKKVTYMQALASDSINEVHPEALTSFIQGAMNQKFFGGDEQDRAIQFQFPQKEMAAVSVNELKKRYEKAANGDVFSEFNDWRTTQANKAMEKAAAAAVKALTLSLTTPKLVERTATITDLDKCQRFDEITAKFGGKKNTSEKHTPPPNLSRTAPIINVELYDNSAGDGSNNTRRFSTGRLANKTEASARMNEMLGDHHNNDHTTSGVSLAHPTPSPTKAASLSANSTPTAADKAKFFQGRRASSNTYDSKDKSPDHRKGEVNHDEEYNGSRTPFSFNENAPTNEVSSVSSTTTKETRESFDQSDKEVVFSSTEVLALRLMFSMYDRSGSATIEYEDLVAYAQETDDMAGIHDADIALDILDIDGDGKIGLLDFIHFAGRLKKIRQETLENLANPPVIA